MILNRTAYNTRVVVSLPPAAPPPSSRFPSQIRVKELKKEPETAEILNVPEIAALMRVSPATVRQMCKRGEIPARKILKRFYITRSALLRFLEGNEGKECQRLKPECGSGETLTLSASTTAGAGLKSASR